MEEWAVPALLSKVFISMHVCVCVCTSLVDVCKSLGIYLQVQPHCSDNGVKPRERERKGWKKVAVVFLSAILSKAHRNERQTGVWGKILCVISGGDLPDCPFALPSWLSPSSPSHHRFCSKCFAALQETGPILEQGLTVARSMPRYLLSWGSNLLKRIDSVILTYTSKILPRQHCSTFTMSHNPL